MCEINGQISCKQATLRIRQVTLRIVPSLEKLTASLSTAIFSLESC